MSDFKAKMHQIRFLLGLRPDPAGGAYSAPPDPCSWIKGSLLLRGGDGREGCEGEGERVREIGGGTGVERGRVGERKSSSP